MTNPRKDNILHEQNFNTDKLIFTKNNTLFALNQFTFKRCSFCRGGGG